MASSNPDLREAVNGILHVLRGSIPWRMVPHDSPLQGWFVALSQLA